MEPWFHLDPFQRGEGGGGKRVSTLLYFQQLVFLDDCVTFRSSRISIYFQPETSVPPFVLIHLLWMQRALRSSTCFPAISSNGLPPPPPPFSPLSPPLHYLFIDGFAAPRAANGIKKTCDARRLGDRCLRGGQRRKVEVRSLETFRKVFEAFFFFFFFFPPLFTFYRFDTKFK